LRIQQEQKRFYDLANAAIEGIVIHDQNKKIVELNSAIEKLMQCNRKELIHKDLSELFSENSLKIIFQRKSKKKKSVYEIQEKILYGKGLVLEIRTQSIYYLGEKLEMISVQDITNTRQLEKQNLSLRATIASSHRMGDMVGKSQPMKHVFDQIIKFSAIDETVLIYGETGKELAAKNIHQLSEKSNKPFIIVNCAAVPDTLFESTFFGYTKGSFTNALSNNIGLFEKASGGVLFLDEIADLSTHMQAKLLRVLENGEYTPLGGKTKYADIRIISASNKKFNQMLADGSMREDFYHRLNVINLDIPPLRKRKEDIPLLIQEFSLKNQSKKMSIKPIPGAVLEQMMAYNWPGNVRELFNELRRYYFTGKMLSAAYSVNPSETLTLPFFKDRLSLKDAVYEFETHYINYILNHHEGDKNAAAKELGVHLRTIYNKLKKE